MKTLVRMIQCAVLLAGLASFAYSKPSVSLGVFYNSLSPYGEWIQMDVGYVWRPFHVTQGWRPYLYGQWVWSDYGWYWVSNEPFGWATFHYGRWIYDDYYGWIWAPDDVWGPAWVEWRYDDDYIGWAPLTPYASFNVSFGISYTSGWVAPVHYWNFVPCRYVTTARVVDYVQPVERARRIFGNSRSAVNVQVEDHRVVNRGVDVRFVERRANVRINRVDVVPRDRADTERLVRASGHERVESFRPRFDREAQADRPREFRADERRRVSEPGGTQPFGRDAARGRQVDPPHPQDQGSSSPGGERGGERRAFEGRRPSERAIEQQSPPPQVQSGRRPAYGRREPMIEQPRRDQPRPEVQHERQPDPRPMYGRRQPMIEQPRREQPPPSARSEAPRAERQQMRERPQQEPAHRGETQRGGREGGRRRPW